MKRSIILLLACWLILPALLHAQDTKYVPITRYPQTDTAHTATSDTIQQRDLYDVIGSLFDHSGTIRKKDSITSKPLVSIIPALGYTLQSKLAVTLAGNVLFRVDPHSRVSSIVLNAAFTQTHQIIIPIQSSIWTRNNDYNFTGDYRYLKYPQSTFGLGSSSKMANEDLMDFTLLRFYETALRHIDGNFYAGAGYVLDAHLNVRNKGYRNRGTTDYERYGARTNTYSSGVTLNTLFDSRDNPINASKGFYASMQYRTNLPSLGSTSRWTSLIIDVRRYYRFPQNSDNVIAFWSYNWLVLTGRPPYLDLPSNTWDVFSGTGRGYIQGRFRGAEMVYAESEYRFRLTRNGLLGGVFFVNAQSFSAARGTSLQSVQPAFGPGIRLKLNKVSKTNIAIDYGIGRQSSRGVFINVGEVF